MHSSPYYGESGGLEKKQIVILLGGMGWNCLTIDVMIFRGDIALVSKQDFKSNCEVQRECVPS